MMKVVLGEWKFKTKQDSEVEEKEKGERCSVASIETRWIINWRPTVAAEGPEVTSK